MGARVRVYIATSADGFIAGPNDELDWLPGPDPDAVMPEGFQHFGPFLAEVGAMLMGRRTWDVVQAMPDWYYGDLPVLVATSRPFRSERPTVRSATGDIDALLDEALAVAGGKDVYVDGGATIRAALEAGRVDDLVVTTIPVLLGKGIPLFAGLRRQVQLRVVSHVSDAEGRMLQVRYRPA